MLLLVGTNDSQIHTYYLWFPCHRIYWQEKSRMKSVFSSKHSPLSLSLLTLLSIYLSLLFRLSLSGGSEYPPSTTPQACIIMPDLLLLCTAGEEGERGIERERERYQTMDGCERRGGRGRGRLPVTKQLLCQKTRRTKHTHTHTHTHTQTCKQSKQRRGSVEKSGSRSVRMMLLRMTTAY